MASELSVLSELLLRANEETIRPINVLIVDDDIEARARVRDLLRVSDADFVFREAENGMIAIDLIKDERPDLLVLDLEMPELDGLGVLRLLREWPEGSRPRSIAVVSTCMSDPVLADGMRLLVADAVYTKPLLYSDVERILDSLVEKPLSVA